MSTSLHASELELAVHKAVFGDGISVQFMRPASDEDEGALFVPNCFLILDAGDTTVVRMLPRESAVTLAKMILDYYEPSEKELFALSENIVQLYPPEEDKEAN